MFRILGKIWDFTNFFPSYQKTSIYIFFKDWSQPRCPRSAAWSNLANRGVWTLPGRAAIFLISGKRFSIVGWKWSEVSSREKREKGERNLAYPFSPFQGRAFFLPLLFAAHLFPTQFPLWRSRRRLPLIFLDNKNQSTYHFIEDDNRDGVLIE